MYKQNRRCVLDGRQVVRISTTSLSVESSVGDRQASNGSDLRRIAHSEWMRKKQEAAQRAREKEERAAKKRQEEEERAAREKEERTRLEKENFLKWIERKRQQELDRRATLENELELQRRLKEIEDNLAGAKTTYLRRWFHRKTEEQKGAAVVLPARLAEPRAPSNPPKPGRDKNWYVLFLQPSARSRRRSRGSWTRSARGGWSRARGRTRSGERTPRTNPSRPRKDCFVR